VHILERTLYKFVHSKKPETICVAYSGGVDSTALLVALSNVVDVKCILALHANHQLQVNSELWEKHCVEQCNQLGVEIKVARLEVPEKGNIEAAARTKRYAFFSSFLDTGDLLLLGHHHQDQVETSLMRVFQGRGLIQMPQQRILGKGVMGRPLLKFTRASLMEYLSQRKCSWVEDQSNSNQSFDRNYIRSTILPVVAKRWPNYLKALDRVITYDRDKDAILRNYFNSLVDPVDIQVLPNEISAKIAWIRGYIESRGYYGTSDRQIEEFVRNLSKSDTTVMSLNSAVLGVYKRQLFCEPAIDKFETEIEINGIPFNLDLGWTELNVEEVGCIDEHCFYASGNLSIRFGALAKKISTSGSKNTRSVSIKKLLSEKSIPTWRRPNYPMIYKDDCLVCVPGIAIDSSLLKEPKEKVKIYRVNFSSKTKVNIV